MGLLVFLIIFPAVIALILRFVTSNGARKIIAPAAALIIGVASLVLCFQYLPVGSVAFVCESEALNLLAAAIDLLLSIVVLVYALRYKNRLALILAIIQMCLTVSFEVGPAHGVSVMKGLYVDQFSIIMALIIGIIGSGICVYALGYMEDFQAHEPEGAQDRRPSFFALLFLFLGAMYLIVFSNNMSWLLTGWEITTVCSFLLIGFTKTDEAIANSFRQIILNMIGGIAFSLALFYSAGWMGTLSLNEFLMLGLMDPAFVIIPVTLLAVAGLTKAAQMPFHTWLLGAMVAPTPTSALLHSSTMVKAGVFLLVRLSPLFAVCWIPSILTILVGGITFLLCSILAIGQSNAKRVLAYSTIANLGLITACAGLGTAEAVWAAIFLIIFHAASKSLLFLCVGTAEHHLGSRNIEDMDNLFQRMPRLARLMLLGIMGMFIAPFGMLISKWAVMVSFLEAGQVLFLVLIAFGSAATFVFWAKWMGKLVGISASAENIELKVHRSEWFALVLMACLTVCCCVFIPVISCAFVEPYAQGIWGDISDVISQDNLYITAALAVFVTVVFLGVKAQVSAEKKTTVYLAGLSVDNEQRIYKNALSQPQASTYRNWYLNDWINEKTWSNVGTALCALIIVVAVLAPWLYPLGM